MIAFLITLVSAAELARLHAPAPYAAGTAERVADTLPRLAFVRDSLEQGSAEQMQQLFPEGYFFSYAIYGLAWIDVGLYQESSRERALAEARWALSHVDSTAGRSAFSPGLDPAYGTFYRGWSAWLRGGIVRLATAGPDHLPAPERTQLAGDAADLAEAFSRNTYPESYPGQSWPCDAVVALAAIRLADRVTGADHSALISSWLSTTDGQRDPLTGLLPHTPGSAARATSQVMILRFLAELDPSRAADDWQRFRRHFASDIPGVPGIREYPRGVPGSGDVDSGPLILGLSLSASTIALGDALIFRDQSTATALTGLAEATGLPVSWGGRRFYAGGVMPLGDAFLAWSRNSQLWTRSMPSTHDTGPVWTWRLPWIIFALQLVMPPWLLFWRLTTVGRRRRLALRGSVEYLSPSIS